MTAGTEDARRTRRIIAQNAQTLRLMGVDFVPVRGGFEAAPPVPAPARAVAPTPIAAAPAPVSPAPRPVPRPSATAPAAAVSAGAPMEPLLIEAKPTVSYTRPDQVEKQTRLDALLARYEQEAPHQHFVTDHHNIVFGEGDPCAKLMFIGEAPGAEEDRVGRPFVGRSGQLLDKMIVALGLRRQDVYIANVMKTRPPNNATPTLDECMKCAPYLFEQVAIIRPLAIVTLGLPATRTVLNSADSMTNLRGRWATLNTPVFPGLEATSIPVMPTYHPAFLLRAYTKENRQKVWSDLQQAAAKIGLAPANAPASTTPAGATADAESA